MTMTPDPAFAAGLLVEKHGTEKALRLCDQNILACDRALDLKGSAAWKAIRAAVTEKAGG